MRARAAWIVVMGIAVVVLAGSPAARAGSLEPPGPPAPTMKTMDQVEPRKPVQSLPGDGQYMHVISQPGSYYLSANMVAPSGMNGILINAVGSVTLDLRGFAMVGERDTLGKKGIVVGPFTGLLTIKNGMLKDWDGEAIQAFSASNATFEDLQIYNSAVGIFAGSHSVVRHCLANGCGNGILAGGVGSTVVDSVADQCVVGIQLDNAGRVEGCTVSNAADYGILVGHDALVRGNTLIGGNGITAGFHRNTIDGNSCTNTGNCVRIETGTGNFVIRNTSLANSIDYLIGAGNTVGPITSDPATAGPWANFAVD